MKSNLVLRPVGKDYNKYELLNDYYYEVNGYVIHVPKGFVTDLASVPRIFWAVFPPFGRYTPAAIVHDFLYSEYNNTGINRTLADKIFLFIMKELGVGYFKRQAMYRGVRMFGEMAWKSKLHNDGYRDKAVIDNNDEAIEYYSYWNKILKLEK